MTSNLADAIVLGPIEKQVRDELDRILESPGFKSTPRRRKLLKYLVEEFLAGRDSGLKGYTIATTVFGRDESFDPQTDPVVRLEARRLRHDLDTYYVSAGRDNPLRITVPKGQYTPVIEWAQEPVLPGLDPLPGTLPRQEHHNGSERAEPKPRLKRGWLLAVALFGLAGVLSVSSVLWYLNGSKGRAYTRGPALTVLPFSTDGLTAQQSVIGRGIADAVLTGLSRFPDLRLYVPDAVEEATMDPIEIGNRLGLTYVLDGSAQLPPGSNALRITARLLEVSTRRVVWIGKYERSYTGGFLLGVQDEIADAVVSTVGQPYGIIRTEDSRRLPETLSPSITSYECVLRAYSYRRSLSFQAYEPSLACLEQAVKQDPSYAEAWAMLGWLQMDAGRFGWTPDGDTQAALNLGLATALHANAVDRNNISSLKALGSIYHYLGKFEESERAQRKAFELNPNDPDTMAQLGWRLAVRGRFDEGIPLLKRAIDRSVNPPGWYYHLIAVDHYLRKEYESMLQSAVSATADGSGMSWSFVAIAEGALNNEAGAKRALQKMADLSPRMARDPAVIYRQAQATATIVDALMEGLVRAGWERTPAP